MDRQRVWRANPRFVVACLATPAVLGTLAFVADETTGLANALLLALFSSGSAWGAAAMVIGYLSPSRRAAISWAVAALVAANLLYYALVLLVSRRWQGGFLDDGSSADVLGLWSIARAAGFWTAVAVLAGTIFALLGRLAAHAPAATAAIAVGTAWGLLAANGAVTLIRVSRWPTRDAIADDLMISAAVTIALAAAVAAAMVVRRAVARHVPRMMLAAGVSCAVGAAGWWGIEAVRVFVSI